MFYPVLRGKRFEVLALRAVAADLVHAGNVRPILEPVKDEWRSILQALNSGLVIGIVTNPKVGSYSPPPPRSRRVQIALPASSAAVYGHQNAIATMIIDEGSTSAEVAAFGFAHPGHRMFLVASAPRVRVPDPVAAAYALNPDAMVILHRAVAPGGNPAVNVALEDYFTRQPNNALYPRDEFYTDRNVTIPADPLYRHFGDYSIQGAQYSDGGGRANNVALHHVYTTGPNPSDLRIRHYVSASHPDVAVMWHDSLSQLVSDLPVLAAMSALNNTSTLVQYRSLHASRAYPGLGKMKELAIRHHLQLLTVVQ